VVGKFPTGSALGRPRHSLVTCPHVNNNPINAIDPSGHKVCADFNEYGKCIKWEPAPIPNNDDSSVVQHNQENITDEKLVGDGSNNTCGPVSACAAAEALGITMTFDECMGKMAEFGKDYNYTLDGGIQPSDFVALMNKVFGGKINITVINVNDSDAALKYLSMNLGEGKQVIVDYLTNQQIGVYPNSSDGPYPFSHFSRVVRYTYNQPNIVLAQTTNDDKTLTAKTTDFIASWKDPEYRAAEKTDHSDSGERIGYWMAVLSVSDNNFH
jgi:hypothetical protein